MTKNDTSKLSKTKAAWQEVRSFTYIILFALCIRIFIFEPFHIPSGSMRKSLIEGDYVFSTKYNYGFSKHSFLVSPNIFSGRIFAKMPERGDIIIFRPPHMMEIRYIKRLVGLPGEKVEIKKGVVYINDIPLKQEFKQEYVEDEMGFKDYTEVLPSGYKYTVRYIDPAKSPALYASHLKRANNAGPFYVPADHFFFMGDNRDQSGDSRFELGYVPFENLISKTQFVFFSFEKNLILDDWFSFKQIKQILEWISSFRFVRFIGKVD